MGNIRPSFIKIRAIALVEQHGEKFTEDFDHNKRMVQQLTDVDSKKAPQLDCRLRHAIPPATNRLRSVHGPPHPRRLGAGSRQPSRRIG